MMPSQKKPSQKMPNSRVTFDIFYPHPPERVWKALTDPEAMRRWLMPTDFRPRPGHRFRFKNPGKFPDKGKSQRQSPAPEETVCCEVVTVDAPRRLAYTWQGERDPAPSLVTWTLERVDGGTRLQLEHTLLANPDGLAFKAEAAVNWQMALHIGLPKALRRQRTQIRPMGLLLLSNARHPGALVRQPGTEFER